jgi:tRNA uridine 5-carbamoylmethylation protein Kti12
MPYIIIITGHPCSGKTTLANTIRERALQVHDDLIDQVVIVDEVVSLSTRRNDITNNNTEMNNNNNHNHTNIEQVAQLCYASSATEKVMRSSLKAAFDRAVAAAVHDEQVSISSLSSNNNKDNMKKKKKTLIILDSTNYIKGYRYELYCICKAATSNYCVAWCLNDINIVKQWNIQRQQQSDKSITFNNNNNNTFYSNDILDALILRYEPPDERNRWDQPLYRIDLRCIDNEHHDVNIQQRTNIDSAQNTTGLAQQLLNQSLYNMHNLSEAISVQNTTENEHTISTEANPQSTSKGTTSCAPKSQLSDTTKVKTASSTFKRSAFQKKTTMNKSVATSQQQQQQSLVTPKIVTTPLTAEALSSFHAETVLAFSSIQPTDNKLATKEIHSKQNQKQSLSSTNINTATLHQDQRRMTLVEQVDEFLLQFIQNVQPLKESTSTRKYQAMDADILHVVDTITQQVCTVIIETIAQKQQTLSTSSHTNERDTTTIVPIATTTRQNDNKQQFEIIFRNKSWYIQCNHNDNNTITTNELYLIRTKYIQWIRKNPIQELENGNHTKIIESFISYINIQFNQRP